MNTYTFSDMQEGMREFFTREITVEMERAFREISGDENPLHKDDDYAKKIGYNGHVSFGLLTASLYSTMAGMYLPGKYSLIHSMEIKFVKPVYAGDVLTVFGIVTGKQDNMKLLRINVRIDNQNGVCVSKADMKVLVLK